MDWLDTLINGLIGGILGVITTSIIYSKKNKRSRK